MQPTKGARHKDEAKYIDAPDPYPPFGIKVRPPCPKIYFLREYGLLLCLSSMYYVLLLVLCVIIIIIICIMGIMCIIGVSEPVNECVREHVCDRIVNVFANRCLWTLFRLALGHSQANGKRHTATGK